MLEYLCFCVKETPIIIISEFVGNCDSWWRAAGGAEARVRGGPAGEKSQDEITV